MTPKRRRERWYNTVWPTRRDFTGCYVKVDVVDEDCVDIWFPSHPGNLHRITRGEARLLAKRINECLDVTVIK